MLRKLFLTLVISTLCAACATPLRMSPSISSSPVPQNDDLRLASATLERVKTYTNMSESQLASVQQAERSLRTRQARRTLEVLNPLERELKSETKAYVVKPGESLWSIAAREDVYANAQLWPLLWRANETEMRKSKGVLQKDQTLKVALHPTVSEILEAIRIAEHSGTKNL